MKKVLIQVNKDRFIEYNTNPFMEKPAFEITDFIIPDTLDNEDKCQELIKFYKDNLIHPENCSMHGACFDIYLSSLDKRIREISRERIIHSCKIAEELKLDRIVFHTNYLPSIMFSPYIENWIIENKMFWTEIINKFDLKILIENSFDQAPELILRLMKEVDSEKIGICLDVGHCNLSNTEMKSWFEQLKDYIFQLHLNDNNGKIDKHLAVGAGTINWKDVSELIKLNGLEPNVVFEMYQLSDVLSSIKFLEKYEYYPY